LADVNAGNLGIKITSDANLAVEAIRSLTKEVNNSNKSLNNMGKESTKALQTMAGTFNSLKSSLLYSIGFGSLYQGLNTSLKAMKAGFQEASNFVENYNLFNVSFAGETKEAIKYQYELNDAFKVNMSESMRYQGFFKNLTSSLGITNEASTLLSENLTNLTYDLSSLYNTSFSAMYSKLQSGIVGQTKPLRSVGIDVTQQTLQPLLYDMGINKYVTELTQAEKVLLRYISILKQSSSAQGDFARTIETPANQLRIFSDQMAEMTRWFGTIFIGTIGKVLPYINALVITLKEVFKIGSANNSSFSI
jgi:CII-binding regulator of phage lambda lysogenization HflD